MARGRGKQASPEPVDQTNDQLMAQPLQFDEPLTWRAGKPIPVTDLLRRLKALSEELSAIDQDDADRDTLVPKAQELVHTQLLDHRDKGVRAYVMVCIVEMFRLLAPDAPYKGGQLKQIFTLFVSSIVPALANPLDPYNQLNTAILASLNTVKSIVLLTDIHGSDSLILTLFTNCFDVMSGDAKGSNGERLPKNLEHHMTGMLCTLVDETASLPAGVIEIILAQFLRADPNAVLSGTKKTELQVSEALPEPSSAYNMARSICNTCADRIVHVIAHYFSSVLVDATQVVESAAAGKTKGKKRVHDESDDDSENGLPTPPAEEDLKEAEKAHRLLRELWRATPDITRNVVPQMEAELRTENVHLREMAVQAVGDMVAGIGAAGPPPPAVLNPAAYPSESLEPSSQQSSRNILLTPSAPVAFSTAYPSAYQALVDRHKDKAWQVRSAFATAAGRIILTSAGGKGLSSDQESQLLRYLSDLLEDMDDHVRLAAIQVVGTFDYESIIKKLGSNGGAATPGSILHGLTDRIKDRKPAVRIAATELLGRLWGVASGSIAEGSERVHELLKPVPSKIIGAFFTNDPTISAHVKRVLFDFLLPINFPPIKPRASTGTGSQGPLDKSFDPDAVRAERILVLVRDLDEERGRKVFFALQQRQPEIAKYLELYLNACEAASGSKKGGEDKAAKKQLDTIAAHLANKFTPDLPLAEEHLRKFAKHHDRRSYQLIRFCYSPESDYRKIVNAMKELTKRMDDAPGGMSAVLETLTPLVRSSSILVYNKSHIPTLVEFSRTRSDTLGSTAHALLKEVSTNAPEIFKIHVKELCESLKKQAPGSATQEDAGVVDTLKACAGFARRFPNGMPKDRDFYKAMVAFSDRGDPPKTAKHAVTVVVSSADKKEMYIKQIEKNCTENFEYGSEGFVSKLAAAAQLRLLANRESEQLAEEMLTIAIEKVLTPVRSSPKSSDPDWTDDINEDLSAKLWALRILVNGLRGMHVDAASEESKEELNTVAAPVYQFLNRLIQREGELGDGNSTPKHHRAHLRLAAGLHLLKLSCHRAFDHLFTPADFNRLSKIAQDPTPEVRAGFLTALRKHLGSGLLPSRFYAFLFLYAFEPDKDTKDAATAWLKARAATHARAGDTVMEATFGRLLSILAHHPDFSSDPDDLNDFVEYILFYLTNVATQANLPMIYHIAQRLKSVQDGIDSDKSNNLYIISDLAEAIIRQFQEVQAWSLQLFSGKLGLPSGIFARLPSHSAAQEIAEKRYLPDEFAEDLEGIVKARMRTKKRKIETAAGQSSKKVRTTSDGTPNKRPSVRKSSSKVAPKVRKTPRKDSGDAVPSSELRKSTRVSSARNYAEGDSSEDDEELEELQEDEAEVEDENDMEEARESSVAASSSPQPLPKPTVKPPARTARGKAKQTGKSANLAPSRSARSRVTSSKKERDIMDVPSDSD